VKGEKMNTFSDDSVLFPVIEETQNNQYDDRDESLFSEETPDYLDY
jgi:hypothetical protein